MKQVLNFMILRSLFLLILNLLSSFCWGMGTTFIKPTTIIPKVRIATPGLTSFETQFVRAAANESYNEFEQRVPLLSFHGTEDLLQRFIDQTLPYNSTQKVGQALFAADMRAHEYGFTFEKNFYNEIFFSFEGTITNTIFKNIEILPVNKRCRLLSKQEIEDSPDLKKFLTTFHNEFIPNCSSSEQKNIGPLFFTLGYAKNNQNFTRADYVDYSFKAGFFVPQFSINTTNSSEQQTFKIPTYQRVNIGIPIQGNIEAGFYEWLNFGAAGIVIPFISNDTFMRLNPTPTNNILFSNDEVLTKVSHSPFIYFDCYIAAEQLIPHFSIVLGFSYAKQFKTKYVPCNLQKYPTKIINHYSLHKPWEIACITLETEVDFATARNKSYPRFKFILAQPIYGKSIFKSWVLAGQCAIEIIANF